MSMGRPAGTAMRGVCLVCRQDYALRKDNTIGAHQQGGTRCPGTGRAPLNTVGAR